MKPSIPIKLIILLFMISRVAAYSQDTIYFEDFENITTADWNRLNLTPISYNHWEINDKSCVFGTKTLHIEDNNDTCSYASAPTDGSQMIAYQRINAVLYSDLKLEFDWVCSPEGFPFDYGQVVYSLDGVNFITISEGGTDGLGNYFDQANAKKAELDLPLALNNSSFYIGFKWINDDVGGVGQNIPFNIDNILITGSNGSNPPPVSGGYCAAAGSTCDSIVNGCQLSGNCEDSLNIWIDGFALSNIDNQNTDCRIVLKGYSDFTNKFIELEPGSMNDVAVKLAGAINIIDPMLVNLWVDWNKDFDFEDPTEELQLSSIDAENFTGTLLVPEDANVGDTLRLRVRTIYSLNAPAFPCDTSNYGEVEDYSIIITDSSISNNCPLVYIPASGSENFCPDSINLQWSNVNNALEYFLEVGSMSDSSDVLERTSMGIDTSFVLSNLIPNQSYFWRIVVVEGLLDTSYCSENEFTTSPGFPQIDFSGSETQICEGDSAELMVTITEGLTRHDGTYLLREWSSLNYDFGNDVNKDQVYFKPTTFGLHTVFMNVEDSVGCSALDSIKVELNPEVNLSVVGAKSFDICSETDRTLEVEASGGSGENQFEWTIQKGQLSLSTVDNERVYNSSQTGIDSVFIEVTDSKGCSDKDIITINVIGSGMPEVAIVSNIDFGAGDAVCNGDPVEFYATTTFEGTQNTITWLVNNSEYANSGSDPKTLVVNDLSDGDKIKVRYNTDFVCAIENEVTSNELVVNIITSGEPSVQISFNQQSECEGEEISFEIESSLNGGNASYQWFVNGTLINGANQTEFLLENAKNNDEVYVLMESSLECVLNSEVSSNVIKVQAKEVVSPEIQVSVNQDLSQTYCGLQEVEFNLDIVSHELEGVEYKWYVDGVLTSTERGFTKEFSLTESEVLFELHHTESCASPNPIVSDVYVVRVSDFPEFNISDDGLILCKEEKQIIKVSIENEELEIVNAVWSGEGVTGYGKDSALFEAQMVGDNTISLQLETIDGCKNQKSIMLTVNDLPEISFVAEPVDSLVVDFVSSQENGNAWFWDFGNGLTSTEKNPSILFDEEGFSEVCLIYEDLNGCINEYCDQVFVSSISENIGLESKIFPNPIKDFVQLEWKGNSKVSQVLLRTIAGELVNTFKVENMNTIEIDFRTYSKGIYYVEFVGDRQKRLQSVKLVKN